MIKTALLCSGPLSLSAGENLQADSGFEFWGELSLLSHGGRLLWKLYLKSGLESPILRVHYIFLDKAASIGWLVPSLLRFLKQLRLVQTARHITTQPPQKNFRLNSSCRSLAISISVWYSASSRKLVSSGSLTKYG